MNKPQFSPWPGRLAWSLFGACLALTLAGLILEGLNRSGVRSALFLYPNALALAVSFPLVGLIITRRQPDNPIGWIFIAVGLSETLSLVAAPYAARTLLIQPDSLPGGAFATWVAYWSWVPGFMLIPFLLLLFPTGCLLSPGWCWVSVVVALFSGGLRARYPLISGEIVTIQTVALVGIAAAVGVAMVRHQLFDIDVVIHTTLVYGLLTAVLALVYFGSVLLLQALLSPLAAGSQAATVASTLLTAALFSPLRRRIQTAIDLRFYRRNYDAARTLAAYGARLCLVGISHETANRVGQADEGVIFVVTRSTDALNHGAPTAYSSPVLHPAFFRQTVYDNHILSTPR